MSINVYDDQGKERASGFVYYEDAAAFVAFLGSGATVRIGENIVVWHEGHEDESAAESYDGAALIMEARARHFAPVTSAVAQWTKRVSEQKEWIAKCGGDLAGYVAKYGSKDDPKHHGDGGEAIYEADTQALAQYEYSLAAARRQAGLPAIIDGGIEGSFS